MLLVETAIKINGYIATASFHHRWRKGYFLAENVTYEFYPVTTLSETDLKNDINAECRRLRLDSFGSMNEFWTKKSSTFVVQFLLGVAVAIQIVTAVERGPGIYARSGVQL